MPKESRSCPHCGIDVSEACGPSDAETCPNRNLTSEQEAIVALAGDIGSCELQEIVEEKLCDGDVRGARVRILGYLDGQIKNGDMSNDEARPFYQRLGFTPDEAANIRQGAKSEL